MTLWFTLLTVTTMLFCGCNLQHNLLYFPSSSLPSEQLLSSSHLKLWPSPSPTDYRGLVASDHPPETQGTIIVFHGNGGTAADRVFYVETLAALGYRVILAEYPRYGGRKGELGEEAFVTDAAETVGLAFAQFGPPLFILGESLGCGVAAAVANKTTVTIAGLVLITPWDTLAAVAKAKFPLLPVRLFLTDCYDNIDNLRSFRGKIAVVGAGRDGVIPIQHAENLFNSITTPSKRMWLIQKAGHNDLLFHTNQIWWREVMDFVNGHTRE